MLVMTINENTYIKTMTYQIGEGCLSQQFNGIMVFIELPDTLLSFGCFIWEF